MKKTKVYSFVLSSLAVSLVSYNAFNSMIGNLGFSNCQNNVCIEAVDDSHSVIHNSGSADILFEKQNNGDSYCYSMTNYETGEDIGRFNSKQDIVMDSNFVQNPKLCALAYSIVWAAMTGGNIAAAVGSALIAAGAWANNGTVIAAITLAVEAGGWAAVPAVIGILSAGEALLILGGAAGVA